MAKEFVRSVDFSKLQPVDASVIRFSGSQNDLTKQVIQSNALSFLGRDLLNLSKKEILLLSDKLRGRFASIAAGRKLVFDRQDLESLKDSDENGFVHELEHLRVIVVLRPELLDDVTINILALLQDEKLKMAMNVMTPIPETDYSCLERAQIMMAPTLPSDQDYIDLYQYIKSHQISIDEIAKIREIVASKRMSRGKTEMLRFLDTLT